MNISTVQKRRFLNNIYRLLYSSGAIVDESLVRSAFNEYFSVNVPGFPINVNYDILRSISKTDVDILNQIMVNTVFNVDILYETILENNEKLFSTVTSLNKKLESLKAKRIELESYVDDLLFMNNNTDGYFYSFTENFSKSSKLDLKLTDSAFFDPILKNVTISKLKSEQFNVVTLDNLKDVSPEFSIFINGQLSSTSVDSTNFANIFDGLTDTYWSHSISLQKPASVSLSISMPVSLFAVVSKIDGVLLTSSPMNILIRATYQDPSKGVVIRSKNSRSDYSSFSFAIPSDRYSNVELVLQKNEPDYIDQNTDSPYVYTFGLRELIIGSKYYAKSGSLISAPISLPVQKNERLVIDAVSIDVVEQIPDSTSINYYIAPDNPLAQNISDFSWIPVSPTGSESSGYPSVVNLDGSSRLNLYIKNTQEDGSLVYIPINSISSNGNELNPTTRIYSDKNIYRITSLDSNATYYNPVLLGNINCFKHDYLVNLENGEQVKYKDLQFWNDQLTRRPSTLLSSVLKEQLGSISPGINTKASGYIQTSLMRNSEINVNHNLIKSSRDFNLAVYLNGVLIADLPKGVLNKAIQWNFIEGENKIVITYDKEYVGQMNFSLVENLNISRYGSVFSDLFRYLDPLEFQIRATNDNYYFTIDTVYGRREILSTKQILGESNFIFTSKNDYNVSSIRYRADLTRNDNPYSSPILETIRIKFKHRDL